MKSTRMMLLATAIAVEQDSHRGTEFSESVLLNAQSETSTPMKPSGTRDEYEQRVHDVAELEDERDEDQEHRERDGDAELPERLVHILFGVNRS